ncbi:hypothetical protein LMG27177_01130 [Paraburkholderia fynbosensis]|uniref:Uncharacterized protein n=1 Tax=Paraburkholderia fynbosensis TaxID=1200993 RepID=A0A6J5FKP6_9BURK|nr:hypothetical protein LMG27177_01130 [Paraburkholderia fynbosensis]
MTPITGRGVPDWSRIGSGLPSDGFAELPNDWNWPGYCQTGPPSRGLRTVG